MRVKSWIQKNQMIVAVLAISLVVGIIVECNYQRQSDQIMIERNDYDGEEKEVDLTLICDEENEKVKLTVNQITYSENEAKRKMKELFDEFDQKLIGRNSSLAHVTSNLVLDYDFKRYPFDMECISSNYSILDEEGYVNNSKEAFENAEIDHYQNGVDVTFTIILWYDEISMSKDYKVCVFPKEFSEKEKAFENAIVTLKEKEKSTKNQMNLHLPVKIGNVKVRYDDGRIRGINVIGFGIVICILLVFRDISAKKEKQRVREENLLRGYPWFVNELSLLLGAGMQMKNIIYKLIIEFERKPVKHQETSYLFPLIEELKVANRGLEMGMSEEQVYYQLGRRLKLPCYIKLMALLEQNVKRGTKNITRIFEQEEKLALEQRKNLAKRYGEEAGTKLLGPMIVLLVIIMLIVIIPAFMGL